MLAETARKGLYDGLEKGELSAALAARTASLDLVTAADVFMYCVALRPIFEATFAALRPGGVFAFSIEAHDGEGAAQLQSSLRIAHGPEAVRAELESAGFRVLERRDMTIRLDRGLPVCGCLFVAQRPEAVARLVIGVAGAEALDVSASRAASSALVSAVGSDSSRMPRADEAGLAGLVPAHRALA